MTTEREQIDAMEIKGTYKSTLVALLTRCLDIDKNKKGGERKWQK